jgi:transposase
MQLRDMVLYVAGVDSHKDSHSAGIVGAATGGVETTETVCANRAGYEELVELADGYCEPSERAWAIEGTGSYGSGLAAFLADRGEWVIEIGRPTRAAKRDGSKSDPLDAIRAAREALSNEHWAQPRARGQREAMRVLLTTRESATCERTRAVNQLKAMIVSAPDELRERLRNTNGVALIKQCKALRDSKNAPVDHRATIAALRRLATRIGHLDEEITQHDRDLEALTRHHCPELLAEVGVGTIVAAQTYIAWSHPGRCRNEAAFASLSGTAPIEASSGKVKRHRLNRHGDRQLNRALHTVAITRARCDEDTKIYIKRRLAEGKSEREARRCLKRYIARHLFRLLEQSHSPKSAP